MNTPAGEFFAVQQASLALLTASYYGTGVDQAAILADVDPAQVVHVLVRQMTVWLQRLPADDAQNLLRTLGSIIATKKAQVGHGR